MLSKVLRFPPTAHRQVQPYAWCWAATTFFENHPQYRDRFRQLRTKSKDTSDAFSNQFYQQLQDQWPAVRDQWQWFVLHMEYGFDIQREAIDPQPVRPLPEDEVDLEVYFGIVLGFVLYLPHICVRSTSSQPQVDFQVNLVGTGLCPYTQQTGRRQIPPFRD